MAANHDKLVTPQALQQSISYEQPLNERIRTCLRLEFLFKQALFSMEGDNALDSHQTLSTIIDILNVLNRSDLKTEFAKEMERQAGALSRLKDAPGIDSRQLDKIVNELDLLSNQLLAINGTIGQDLRQHELLNSVRHRNSIPGGACGFDLPVYHYWLQQAHKVRRKDLEIWMNEFTPVINATKLILHLIRESSLPNQETATGGNFQKSLAAQPLAQLLRVTVPASQHYYPEISAGKHRFSVRFMQMNGNKRPTQVIQDIDFELTCCSL